jgi:hypothetical protein
VVIGSDSPFHTFQGFASANDHDRGGYRRVVQCWRRVRRDLDEKGWKVLDLMAEKQRKGKEWSFGLMRWWLSLD